MELVETFLSFVATIQLNRLLDVRAFFPELDSIYFVGLKVLPIHQGCCSQHTAGNSFLELWELSLSTEGDFLSQAEACEVECCQLAQLKLNMSAACTRSQVC